MRPSVLFALLALLALVSDNALGCSCGRGFQEPEIASDATIIFAGTVIRERMTLAPATPYQEAALRVDLAVDQVWKGELSRTIQVETGFGGGDCGIDFVVGRSFLVYASDYRGRLVTGMCHGTLAQNDPAEASLAKRHLEYLGPPRRTFHGEVQPAGALVVRVDRLVAAGKTFVLLYRILRGNFNVPILGSPAFLPGMTVLALGVVFLATISSFAYRRSLRLRNSVSRLKSALLRPEVRRATALAVTFIALAFWATSLYRRWWDLQKWIGNVVDFGPMVLMPILGIAIASAFLMIRRHPQSLRLLLRAALPLGLLVLWALELGYTWTSYSLDPWSWRIYGPGDTPLGMIALALFPPETRLAPAGATLFIGAVLAACVFGMRRAPITTMFSAIALIVLMVPASWSSAVLAVG